MINARRSYIHENAHNMHIIRRYIVVHRAIHLWQECLYKRKAIVKSIRFLTTYKSFPIEIRDK